MNLFKISLFGFCFLQTYLGLAQVSVDSIKHLPAVEVSSSRLTKFSSGNKNESLDSALLDRYTNHNLSDLLSNESQVFIKSYGLGSLATTSFRGAGANHTAVLWNGFNIQSPMNGLLDMSLIPVNFLNDVKLQYGGAGALWGSGAVGGTIHLNNTVTFNKGFSVMANASFGSFSDDYIFYLKSSDKVLISLPIQKQISMEISKKRFSSSVKLFSTSVKNNFPFINTAQYGKLAQKQSNAELKQYGLLQENYFNINDRQKINVRFWYQNNDRNIPPSMTQNINVSNQKDELYRVTSEWERKGKKLQFLLRSAYFDEKLVYSDSLIGLLSKSRTQVLIAEAESRFSITKFDLINIGINNTYSKAITDNYVGIPEQERFAVFASYKLHTTKNTWTSVISARQEFINGNAVPFTSSLGVEGTLLKYFTIKANAAQHYRIPTFNDLYWAQGGNPLLKPEKGWSEEASLIYKHFYKAISWELGATGFNRNIDNWIIWLPNQYGIWTPENVLKVSSRGLEYKLKLNYLLRNFKVQLSGLYNYVLSTNTAVAVGSETSLHKQLIYVPIQNAQGNMSISYKSTSLSYTHIYTGYRYTLSDNTEFLRPYTVGNVHVAQLFHLKKIKIKVYAQLNNVWQETYQVLAYRAMPLFNYQFGSTFYFDQHNEK